MTLQNSLPPNFNVVLEAFVCECVMTSILILGEGGGDIMSEERRILRTINFN